MAPRRGRTRPRRWGSFPTTADVGIWARGATPAELLEALGLGLYALMTDLRTVRPRLERAVSASGEDPTSLAVAFLNGLLALESTEGFLVREIEVRMLGRPPTALIASARGEPFDSARHPSKIEVKAVTLHEAIVDFERGRARLILDI